MTDNPIPAIPALPGVFALAKAALDGDTADPAATLRRAVLDPLRPAYREQAAAVRAAGAKRKAAAAALATIEARIADAGADAARVADLERVAAEAADVAGRIHARRFAAGGGETAESRAADRAAREAAQAVAAAREAAGPALAMAERATAMRAEAAAQLEAADRDLATALAELIEMRANLVHAQIILIVSTTLRPAIEILDGDRRALRELVGFDTTTAGEVRAMAREGIAAAPPDQRAVRDAAQATAAALRRAAGVPEAWAWRLPEAERQPAAVLPMPARRSDGRGVKV